VRTALYFAALAAARFHPGLAAFYRRLRAAGKCPRSPSPPSCEKLVVLANVLVREDRLRRPSHA